MLPRKLQYNMEMYIKQIISKSKISEIQNVQKGIEEKNYIKKILYEYEKPKLWIVLRAVNCPPSCEIFQHAFHHGGVDFFWNNPLFETSWPQQANNEPKLPGVNYVVKNWALIMMLKALPIFGSFLEHFVVKIANDSLLLKT